MLRRLAALEQSSELGRTAATDLKQRVGYWETQHDAVASALQQLLATQRGGEGEVNVRTVAEDVARMRSALQVKAAADQKHAQQEQHKSALLFAEVARMGHQLADLSQQWRATTAQLRASVDELRSTADRDGRIVGELRAAVSASRHGTPSPARSASPAHASVRRARWAARRALQRSRRRLLLPWHIECRKGCVGSRCALATARERVRGAAAAASVRR